ncbi:MAG: DUF6427 family protein [Flavobacteriaceae bacterium]
MLTNFLKKTTPVNFLVISGLAVFYLVLSLIDLPVEGFLGNGLGAKVFVITLFTVLLLGLNFFVYSAKISRNTTLIYLYFTLFLCLFPGLINQYDFLMSQGALIVALWRLMSLNPKELKVSPLFDIGFWLGVSGILVPETLIFLPILYLYFFSQGIRYLRFLVLPIISVSVVLFLYFTYCYVWLDPMSFDRMWSWGFTSFVFYGDSFKLYFYITILLLMFIHGSGVYNKNQQVIKKDTSLRMELLLALFIFAGLMLLSTANKYQGVYIYLSLPIAIYMANYIDFMKEGWIRESIFIFSLSLPLISYFL